MDGCVYGSFCGGLSVISPCKRSVKNSDLAEGQGRTKTRKLNFSDGAVERASGRGVQIEGKTTNCDGYPANKTPGVAAEESR